MSEEFDIKIVESWPVQRTLAELLRLAHEAHIERKNLMALGQDILQAVTDEDTKVDSFIALVNGLISAGTIPADVGAAILAKIKGSEDKLDAAIGANTPVTPVVPTSPPAAT